MAGIEIDTGFEAGSGFGAAGSGIARGAVVPLGLELGS
jgi:hypothetical protein